MTKYPKVILINSICIMLVALLFSCSTSPEYQSYFEEGDSSWTEVGDANWEFINSEIVEKSDSVVGYMVTKDKFSNFELIIEFQPDDKVNSGIFIRCSSNDDISDVNCYEVNIWDNHPDQTRRTGSIAGRAEPLEKVDANGKWNTYRITATGSRIEVWINDIKTADYMDDSLPSGHIALQKNGNGVIKFRNAKIRSL